MQNVLGRINDPEGYLLDPSLVLYLPLHQLDGASFMSKDAYGYLATVTGATWGIQGRTFAGAEFIDLGTDAVWSLGANDFTLAWWEKRDNTTNTLSSFGFGTAGYQPWQIQSIDTELKLWMTEADLSWSMSSAAVSWGVIGAGVWSFYALTRLGSVFKLYKTESEVDTFTDAGTVWADSGYSFRIGSSQGGQYLVGTMGEVIIHVSRAASLIELIHIRNSTKWRYI